MELSRRQFLAFLGVAGGVAATDAPAEPPKPSVIGVRRVGRR